MFEEALLVCALLTFCYYTKKDGADLRDDIIRHILSKHSLSRFPLRGKAFFGSTTTHFLRGLLLSTFFLSAFLKTTRAREGRVLCSFKGFSGDEGAKKRVFVHTNNARVFRSPSEGAERRRTRAVECNRSRGMKRRVFFVLFFSSNKATKMLPTASTRTRRREKMEARPTTGEREKSEDNGNGLLWRIVMDHQDIFDTHIVTKLNGNDVKFFTT